MQHIHKKTFITLNTCDVYKFTYIIDKSFKWNLELVTNLGQDLTSSLRTSTKRWQDDNTSRYKL